MARQILLSDDEEVYLREIGQANLKGLALHDVMHDGPNAASTRTRGIVMGLLRKLGLEVTDEAAQDPNPLHFPADFDPPEAFPPGPDLPAMVAQMLQAVQPMMLDMQAAQLAARLYANAITPYMNGSAPPSGTQCQRLARACAKAAATFFDTVAQDIRAHEAGGTDRGAT